MFLEVRDVSKAFGSALVLNRVSFAVEKSRTLAVLGRSGCGKTTLLKVLAGILAPDSGRVLRDGQDVTSLAIRRRDMVYLYQETLLFPHLSVFENVAFGLRLRHVEEGRVQERVRHLLDSLELRELADRSPHQLSGGQRQRVSFGRALVVNPSVLLLDEPFSSLDTETRSHMQALFKRVAGEYAITAVFVTHDLKEALVVGDQWSHLHAGRLDLYPSKGAFVDDPESGVAREREFWETVGNGRHAEPV